MKNIRYLKKGFKKALFLLKKILLCGKIKLFHSDSGAFAFAEQRRYLLMKQEELSLDYVAGRNLKRYIKESKWKTQASFAEAFHADIRSIERWCKRIDSIRQIQELAEFLGVDPLALLSK